jgi:hypothetical protein
MLKDSEEQPRDSMHFRCLVPHNESSTYGELAREVDGQERLTYRDEASSILQKLAELFVHRLILHYDLSDRAPWDCEAKG